MIQSLFHVPPALAPSRVREPHKKMALQFSRKKPGGYTRRASSMPSRAGGTAFASTRVAASPLVKRASEALYGGKKKVSGEPIPIMMPSRSAILFARSRTAAGSTRWSHCQRRKSPSMTAPRTRALRLKARRYFRNDALFTALISRSPELRRSSAPPSYRPSRVSRQRAAKRRCHGSSPVRPPHTLSPMQSWRGRPRLRNPL